MVPVPKQVSGLLVFAAFLSVVAATAPAQQPPDTVGSRHLTDSTNHTTRKHYWRNFGAGFAASILAHEAGHVGMSYALGARPTFGFEDGKPTVFSGIDANLERQKQFLFSSAGLTVQSIIDEAILDFPSHRGGSFERGILAGGIGTAYFYATFGRNAPNSDITYMARTSSLSRTQASLIFAGIATLQAIRIARDGHYANFFLRPASSGAINVGVSFVSAR
ncbi:MAG: hypothetical protein ABI194_02055 [Gemmatimonadaceae bacterium]